MIGKRSSGELEKGEGRRVPKGEQINLPPGFRFNPTDEELVVHYLSKRASSQPFPTPIIADLDLYKFDPWDLPDKALFGENEWYFFTPRNRKYPNGQRPDRSAGSGYWKATGTDKPITTSGLDHLQQTVGVKKSLVFYRGKPPQGLKTDWIMHEYRLPNAGSRMPTKNNGNLRLDDWVLCRVYEKTSSAAKVAKDMWDYHSSCMDGVSTNSSSSKLECSSSSGLGTNARANPSNIRIDTDNDEIISSTHHYRTNSSHVCKVEDHRNNKDYMNMNSIFDSSLGARNWMTNTPTTRPTLGMGLFNLEGLPSPFGHLDSILSPPLCGGENDIQYRDT